MFRAPSSPPVFPVVSLFSPVLPTSVAHRIQAALVNPAPSPVLTSSQARKEPHSPNPGAWAVPQESPDPLLLMSSAPVRAQSGFSVFSQVHFLLLFLSLPWGPFTFQGCQVVMNCFRGSSPLSECSSRTLLHGPECSRQLSSFCLLVGLSLV